MLHELLLALFGIPGGLFLETEGDFRVNPKLKGTLLSPAEVELLDRIVILGYYSKRIQSFISKYGGISTKLALQIAYSGQQPDDGEINRSNEVMSANQEGDNNSEVAANQEDSNEEIAGVYIKAFCQGVSEIVNVYKEHLLLIEHEYLRDRSLTIPQVQ